MPNEPQPGAPSGAGQPELSGLPALQNLPKPKRQASNLGPGWLALSQDAIVSSSGVTPESDGTESLLGVPEFAYAIYCAYGFDGDNGPTSARITSPSLSGKFYVGFSDYQDGKWLFSGPYSMGSAGGTTEITIPNTGQFVSPNAFIGNYFHATYVAVVTKKGASLSHASVELGIHGGRLGPRPAEGIDGTGNLTGVTVQWTASPDEMAPDFAGYLIERAGLWSGTYTPLNATPVRGSSLPDPGAQMDQMYRYRIAAVDTSGNLSVWVEGYGLTGSTYHQHLIPVVHGVPDGPVYGPAQLNINMGDSYDPEGAALDTYTIKDWQDTLYSSPGLGVVLTLQPGCHKLTFIVASGSKHGQLVKYLKVLPRWQDSAYMVSAPQSQGTIPRVAGLAMKRTADGALHMLGYDPFIPGMIDRRIVLGHSSELHTAPAYETPQVYCEPQVAGDHIFTGYAYDKGWVLYNIDPTGIQMVRRGNFTMQQVNPQLAVVNDGLARLWVILAQDDGVFRLNIESPVFPSPVHLVDPLPSLLDVDAVYDPSAGVIWVVYSTNATTEWLKVNPDTLAVVDSGTLAAFPSPNLDIEYDSTNAMPIIAYYSAGFIYYSYNDGAWHAGEQVDPTGGNGMAFDLDCLAGTPHIAMCETGAQASVYTRIGANNWSHADVAYSANSGMQLGLAAFEDGGVSLAVADVGTNRHVYADWIKPGGVQSLFYDSWPTTGQGLQMHGTGGADGLHVIWDQMFGPPMHVIGAADGKTWAASTISVAAQQLDLESLADGSVYASWNDGVNATLQRWDTPAWTQIASLPSSPTARPFLAHGAPSTVVSWLAYDDSTHHVHVWKGNQMDGYDTADSLFDGNFAYTGTGVISSALALPQYSTDWYIIRGNPVFDYAGSSLGYFRSLDDTDNVLISHSLTPDAFHSLYVMGRNIASAKYYSVDSSIVQQGIWLSNGVEEPAWRYTPNFTHTSEYTDLPTNTSAPGFDARRTVSAATTPHDLTALALVCDMSGHDQYLEWSNYGTWERLPLPPADISYDSNRYMYQAALFVGTDGRWHIIYRDYDTDTIYCRSTL